MVAHTKPFQTSFNRIYPYDSDSPRTDQSLLSTDPLSNTEKFRLDFQELLLKKRHAQHKQPQPSLAAGWPVLDEEEDEDNDEDAVLMDQDLSPSSSSSFSVPTSAPLLHSSFMVEGDQFLPVFNLNSSSSRIREHFRQLALPRNSSRANDVTSPCGGIFNITTYVELASPNYPNHYPPNSYCRWIIQAGEHQTLNVEIVKLKLEYDNACRLDYLDVTGKLSFLY